MKKYLAYLIIFILTLSVLFSFNTMLVNAEVNLSSSVLNDLAVDSSFDIDNYNTFSIQEYINLNSDNDTTNNVEIAQIIQIAETTSNEIYIYVFCPTYKEFVPNIKKINMYDEFVEVFDDELNTILYDLELIGSEFGFYKYRILNYQVSSLAVRYYSIIELLRLPSTLIDKVSSDFNTNYKSINVSQQWRTYYLNNKFVYEMDKLETVVIDITHNGSLFFEGKSKLTWYLATESNNTRSYFICFNALNYAIDEIYDAKLTYTKTSRVFSRTGGYEYLEEHAGSSWHTTATLGEPEIIKDSVSNMENVNIETPGIFGKKFNWKRIMTGKDFVTNLTKQGAKLESSKTIEDSQWVFTYHEYDCEISEVYQFYTIHDYVIDDVKILTLHFRSGQNTYNLGVVSDITSPDNKDDGGYNTKEYLDEKLNEFFEKIMSILFLIILLIFLGYILGPFIYSFIIFIFKFILNILKLPFTILVKLFRKNKKNKP